MTARMLPQIRLVRDNVPSVILPDWRTIGYIDDCFDVGALTFEYPMGGTRISEMEEKAELALFVDGEEIPNGRFFYDEESGNRVTDTPGFITYACPSYLSVLEEVVITPRPKGNKKKDDKESEDERATRQRWEEERTGEQERSERRIQGDDADNDVESVSVEDDVQNLGMRVRKTEKESDKDEDEDDDPDKDKDKREPPKGPLFKKVTAGELLLTVIRGAQGRGAAPNLAVDFTKKHDSNGKPWDVWITVRPEVGSTALELVQWLHDEKAAEVRCQGRTLQAFVPETGMERPSVRLARGRNVVDGPRQKSTRDVITAVYVVSDAGPHGWVVDKALQKKYRSRKEGYLSLQGVDTWKEARERGEKYLKAQGKAKQQLTFGITALEGAQPYRDFEMADWVWVMDGEAPEKMRVRVVTLDWNENGGCTAGVTLNDRLYERSITAHRKTRKITGKTLTSTPNSAGGGRDDSDGRAPKRPSAPAVTSRAGVVRVAWDGYDEEGVDPIWDQALVEVHVGDDEEFEPSKSSLSGTLQRAGSVVIPDQEYGVPKYVKFVAVDEGGDRSDGSAAAETLVEKISDDDLKDDETPGVPEAYFLGGIGTIFLKWAPVPNGPDNARYRVYGSETPGVVPGPDTLYAEVQGAMAVVRNMPNGDPFPFTTTGATASEQVKTYVDTYWVVTAIDRDGESEPSEEMAARPSQVTGPDVAVNTVTTNMMIANSVTADKIDFVTLRGKTVIGMNIRTGDPGTNHMALQNDGAGGVLYGYSGRVRETSPAVINPAWVDSLDRPVLTIAAGLADNGFDTQRARVRLKSGGGDKTAQVFLDGHVVVENSLTVNGSQTNAQAPNVFIGSGGLIQRSTYDVQAEINQLWQAVNNKAGSNHSH